MIKQNLMLFLLFFSCSHVDTINLRYHSFGDKPVKIIWWQVAGLLEEHLAMLRFGMSEANKKTAFEEMSCIGKTWNYNLFKLRPDISEGFRAQLLGSPNIKGQCSDLEKMPVWDYLKKMDYKTGVVESNMSKKDSVLDMLQCKERWDNVVLWTMNKKINDNYFHYQEKQHYDFGKVYYDKSCQGGSCYSSLFDNTKNLERFLDKKESRYLFLIRELGYSKAIESGNILKANEILLELEKILAYFIKKYENDHETLILVTSTGARNIEFPIQGNQWAKFIQKGKGVIFKNRSLVSAVFAYGASAENFCGVYDEYEILHRLFWMTNTSAIKQKIMDIF